MTGTFQKVDKLEIKSYLPLSVILGSFGGSLPSIWQRMAGLSGCHLNVECGKYLDKIHQNSQQKTHCISIFGLGDSVALFITSGTQRPFTKLLPSHLSFPAKCIKDLYRTDQNSQQRENCRFFEKEIQCLKYLPSHFVSQL